MDVNWYRVTSLIRKRTPLAPYSKTMPRALWKPQGGGLFLMSEVPLYNTYNRWLYNPSETFIIIFVPELLPNNSTSLTLAFRITGVPRS